MAWKHAVNPMSNKPWADGAYTELSSILLYSTLLQTKTQPTKKEKKQTKQQDYPMPVFFCGCEVLITTSKGLLPDVGINLDLIGISGRFRKLSGKVHRCEMRNSDSASVWKKRR